MYLLEDALDLWAAVLVQTPSSAASDVLTLAPYLFSVLELGTEHLRKALEILESYIVLAPTEMLNNEMGGKLFGALASLLGTLKSETNGIITHLVELSIREAEHLGGEAGVLTIVNSLVSSGLLIKIFDGLRGSWEAHQTTGPSKKVPRVDGIVETDYFSVISRLIIPDPHGFIVVVQAIQVPRGEDIGQTMSWLLTEWFSHFGNIGHPVQRKLGCLALTSLLRTGTPWILGRLQDLMTVWTDVLAEVQEGTDDNGGE